MSWKSDDQHCKKSLQDIFAVCSRVGEHLHWSNRRPRTYISLAIREITPNPIQKITKENLINY